LVLLVEVGACAWAEPASFAVNVLENMVAEVNDAAITPTPIHAFRLRIFPNVPLQFSA
jgi:hypothetical protein